MARHVDNALRLVRINILCTTTYISLIVFSAQNLNFKPSWFLCYLPKQNCYVTPNPIIFGTPSVIVWLVLEVSTVKQGRQSKVLTRRQFPIFLNTKMTISNICQRCQRAISRLDSGAVLILYYQELQDFWTNPNNNRWREGWSSRVPQLTCIWMSGANGLGNQTRVKSWIYFINKRKAYKKERNKWLKLFLLPGAGCAKTAGGLPTSAATDHCWFNRFVHLCTASLCICAQFFFCIFLTFLCAFLFIQFLQFAPQFFRLHSKVHTCVDSAK